MEKTKILALENVTDKIKYSVDIKNFIVAISDSVNPVIIIPLSDILNIAAIYKAEKNEASARSRKEKGIRMFGLQGNLDFKERG